MFHNAVGAPSGEGPPRVISGSLGRVARDPAILWASQANFRGNERNTKGFRSAEIEKLGADGAAEPDPAKRKAIYQKLNEMMVDESYLIMVATDPRIWPRWRRR